MNQVMGGSAGLGRLGARQSLTAEPVDHHEAGDGVLSTGSPELRLGGGANTVSPYPR